MDIVESGETSIACGVAERFQVDRILLAGDAAHVMPPTGGLGGNTAILDGLYLGWRLAAVLQGWAGPHLLRTFETERRPYARLLVEQQSVYGAIDLLAMIDEQTPSGMPVVHHTPMPTFRRPSAGTGDRQERVRSAGGRGPK
ncbi:FAD-dependent monooxygenase [Micromonospora sp. WMMD736]|uniref:FAD-dependent monooxygenase n=1 Tax=Micromonospora sp. WMMD736 TaxID=3404112 RepID=UPI003B95445B